jgi:hypothetical protein
MDLSDGMIFQGRFRIELENSVGKDGLIIWILLLIKNLGVDQSN